MAQNKVEVFFNYFPWVSNEFGNEYAYKKLTIYGRLSSVFDYFEVAGASQVVIRIKYRNRDGKILFRWIEPFSYRTEHGKFYLYALCRLHMHIHKWIPASVITVTFSDTGLKYSNPENIKIELGKSVQVVKNEKEK